MRNLVVAAGVLVLACCHNPAPPAQTSRSQPSDAADPQGGEIVDGYQVVLKSEKQVWEAREKPEFTANLLEVGPGTLQHSDPPRGVLVEYDGERYRPTNQFMAALPDARGAIYGLEGSFENLEHVSTKDPLVPASGKHQVRVGFQLRPPDAEGKNTEVWSRPLAIEIRD